ncbi:hypothetical protein [uncultured Zobellia sp.]|uniref:hypothetical protein n=1 Tax=uncultured Zobellia sp. TaxID=255433 RepID=UPI0025991EF9|nr:hypothetical protein [uncultured Zobellia sp.]
MKNLVFVIFLFTSVLCNAQNYSFVPDSLRLISYEELMKNPPSNVGLVYYENGTPTTFKEVIPLVMQKKLTPQMFVDKDGNHKILVVVEAEVETENISIAYEGIPEKLKKLGYSFGNSKSDTIVLIAQGGPFPRLFTDEVKAIFKEKGEIDETKYFIINTHQAQTIEPQTMLEKEISFDKAKMLGTKTSAMLHELVSYFKSENKKVFIVGISYGCFAGQDYISKFGNIADGYLLMVGRLDIAEEVWRAYSEGIDAGFEEDAISTKVEQKAEELMMINSHKVAAAYGYKRYSELLKNTDLSNLIYYHALKDANVGKLTEDEIDFLNTKGAHVVGFDDVHTAWRKHLKEALELLLAKQL